MDKTIIKNNLLRVLSNFRFRNNIRSTIKNDEKYVLTATESLSAFIYAIYLDDTNGRINWISEVRKKAIQRVTIKNHITLFKDLFQNNQYNTNGKIRKIAEKWNPIATSIVIKLFLNLFWLKKT